MTDSVVLREKLRVPEGSWLSRERLENRLLSRPPTIVDMVVAPAGYGKTTLLARVAATCNGPVGWYRITSEDATESRLVAHLAEALTKVVEIDGTQSMSELLAVLDQWTGSDGLLIIDDLHEIAETPAEKALERFIALRPRRLQLICGSRRLPDVNMPRIRVSGPFREVGPDDLRFRSWEVEELFTSVYREPLRPEEAAVLTRRTGGWAAGLQLFHLATSGRTTAERHQAVACLGGKSKLVRSYLARNVLAELSDDRREFLLRTCTLGRLSGEACDALLGGSGSHRILEELESAQLFTFTDDGGVYFRYHEVLQTHLELALAEEYGPSQVRAWYRKSAVVLESVGELRSAARAYAKAGDWVSVSRLVKDTRGAQIDATVVDDAHLLPSSTWQHDPWLALANARRLVREGALQRAADAYRCAQRLYDEPDYRQQCGREGQVVSMWLPGPTDDEAGPPVDGEVRHWSVFLRQAVRRSPDFRALPAVDVRVRLVQGLAAVAAGEIRLARSVLASIRRDESAESLDAISASLVSAALDLIDGDDVEATSQLSALASVAESEGLPWLSRMCHGLEHIVLVTSQGRACRLGSCSEVVRSAERAGDAWGAGLLGFALGLARQRAGEDASGELSSAAKQFEDLGAPVLEMWCRLLAMRAGTTVLAARQAVRTSQMLRARGAQAWALALLATVAPDDQRGTMATATELAARCGIRLPVTESDDRSSPTGNPDVQVAEGSGSSVVITCFGGYRMAINGEESPLAQLRPQARALLQILSLNPDRDHHRECLEDILWPGIDHSVARHRLQVAVSSVRSILCGAGVAIRRRGENYRLSLCSGASVDVRDFTKAISKADILSARGDLEGRMSARRHALGLYTGDLLPEVTRFPSIETERDRLRHSAAAAAAALASDHRTLGEYEQAFAMAQRSVQLEPYQEISWLILADLHEKLGDSGSAEYVRREHSRRRAELGVSGY